MESYRLRSLRGQQDPTTLRWGQSHPRQSQKSTRTQKTYLRQNFRARLISSTQHVTKFLALLSVTAALLFMLTGHSIADERLCIAVTSPEVTAELRRLARPEFEASGFISETSVRRSVVEHCGDLLIYAEVLGEGYVGSNFYAVFTLTGILIGVHGS